MLAHENLDKQVYSVVGSMPDLTSTTSQLSSRGRGGEKRKKRRKRGGGGSFYLDVYV